MVPSPKKAKLSPVQKEVGEVLAALGSDDFQVAGSKQNQEMLLALAPCILETPSDKRHPMQVELGEILKEVFATEASRLKEKVQVTQTEMDGATADMASRKAAVEAAAADVERKDAELKAKMATLAADVGVARTAKSTLEETVSEVSSLQEMKELHVSEQQDVAAKAESFTLLKDGQATTKAPKELVPFFRKLKVDSSLVAALPTALARGPQERSPFDALTVTELEKKLTSKVEECDTKVKETETQVAQKAAVKETHESALTAALTKQRAGAEALLQARGEHKDLTAVLAEKKTQVMDGQTAYKALEAELLSRTSEVEFHEKVQGKLTELLERQSPAEIPAEAPPADAEVATGEKAQE
eukprot:gnl/MRDRNA2_/MRDRNA2_87470_c0_seq1.p1 gnl/MRDRNA2_/MRDRNA2_87470_c0~~gnl/MRDRNA2_/MRDRNA2_87470_c0_seq1.p1  ORF type:complete len:389 (-),score=142.41 gnl/MRDRNA2_/MRDRNA2_87470_c0_seq1:268-1341(-)